MYSKYLTFRGRQTIYKTTKYLMVLQQAKDIRDMADELNRSYEDLQQELGEMIINGSEALKNGLEQQQTADLLLADADAAVEKAEEAIKLGELTLKEANETYYTLQGTF